MIQMQRHRLELIGGTSCNFYIAEFQEIDGLALDASYFGETDVINRSMES